MFEELRPGQKLVLDEYMTSHIETQDLAIEMPTGEGKTLVALLIADYALDRGWSVAYLAGTRQLAESVEKEAHDLGLDAVKFASRRYGGNDLNDYHEAQAVGVMNYWVYFNSSPVPQPADLVIFDDAHLAEQPLSGLNTLRIPFKGEHGERLYRALCDRLMVYADKYPGLNSMRYGTALPGAAPELISFEDWAAVSAAVEALIAESPLAKEGDAKYVWPQMLGKLKRCGVLVGPDAIEIRPYHPTTSVNTWYKSAKQRIYMSATLGSMDDLQRRLGVGTVARLMPPRPLPEGQTGSRQLLLNPTTSAATSSEMIAWALGAASEAGGRAVWLCASNAEADLVSAALIAADETTFRLKAGDDAAIDRWISAKHGHLITAGRYDGLDLRGDICKVVLVVGVPQSSSEFERFIAAYVGDASHMRHRIGQRITQALGRANRVPTDRALYLALDPKFGQLLADPSVLGAIPDPSRVLVRQALEMHGQGWDATEQLTKDFWKGQSRTGPSEQDVTHASSGRRKRRPGRLAAAAVHIATAPYELSASTDLWIGSHESAADAARHAAAELTKAGEIEHAAFWRYVQAHALYESGSTNNRHQSKAILQDVVTTGPRTAWFRRLATTTAVGGDGPAQVNLNDRIFLAWEEWLTEPSESIEKCLSVARLHLDGDHDEQSKALIVLARLLGVLGELPHEKEQAATDCRWSWSTPHRSERRIWEVKTGKATEVPRIDVNQLLGQIEVETQRSRKHRVFGCLLTPTASVTKESGEAAREKISIIHQPAALRLYDLLADKFREYASLRGIGDAMSRGAARAAVESSLPPAGRLERLLSPSGGRVRSVSEVEALFASN
ncbi:DEAD/DEAH box helicase [Paenarthrobacter ilicis]|uniref:DEAD/DEAH box helicase n=1 Tax=Paenarthrobacter ilicis TaxID=43665 RepID=UPI00386C622F